MLAKKKKHNHLYVAYILPLSFLLLVTVTERTEHKKVALQPIGHDDQSIEMDEPLPRIFAQLTIPEILINKRLVRIINIRESNEDRTDTAATFEPFLGVQTYLTVTSEK